MYKLLQISDPGHKELRSVIPFSNKQKAKQTEK